jgi:hypothetical protein
MRTTLGRSPTVEAVKPFRLLSSWVDARLDAEDPYVSALVEIICGGNKYYQSVRIKRKGDVAVCEKVSKLGAEAPQPL